MANTMAENGNGYSKMVSIVGAIAGSIGIIGSMLAWIYTLQDRVTRNEVALHEIETQFCAQDIVRNLMHAHDLREYAVLYKKVYGEDYPIGNTYYPTICNRPIRN
jgi:hypothetical protein